MKKKYWLFLVTILIAQSCTIINDEKAKYALIREMVEKEIEGKIKNDYFGIKLIENMHNKSLDGKDGFVFKVVIKLCDKRFRNTYLYGLEIPKTDNYDNYPEANKYGILTKCSQFLLVQLTGAARFDKRDYGWQLNNSGSFIYNDGATIIGMEDVKK